MDALSFPYFLQFYVLCALCGEKTNKMLEEK